MHPKNKHKGAYDLIALQKAIPELGTQIIQSPDGRKTIDFSNPVSVKLLNKALLKKDYHIDFWDIPEGYLCPPIPGRVDYIHHMADVVNESLNTKNKHIINCLDIGTGANCIYPILGSQEYGWKFVASDIDKKAVKNAREIISKNDLLKGKIEIRYQENSRDIFRGIIQEEEYYHLTFCNPPFYESAKEVELESSKKVTNLGLKSKGRNFAGRNHELWRSGGEKKFINDIAFQSKFFKDQVLWFSTLVSKKENLKDLYKTLKKVGVKDIKTINMLLGNKVSRVVTWRY
ncbi:23S rRNA (adenine(1618)-N(6))-methyltransferase RlmF [Jiulongibacter sp. NS-SX5]|uniref:23S rRNA (adenine(1618)-N(6))-methyltransferase RlmF n=1 Tax=Jiulongibacter sp. NS-SX5 TaxID=3463854 RepID=UPI00405997F5